MLCIGAPYGVQIKTGKPDFPSSFGCAYIVDELKNRNLDFNAGTQEEKRNEHKYPGWKMRAEFSHMKYISFPQKISILPLFFGEHSYLSVPRYYKYNNKIIGYHLFRGSFVATNSISDWKNQKNIQISKHKVDTRYLYSKFFYGLISGSNFSFIKEVGLIKIAINIFKLCFCKIIVDEDGSQNPYHIIVIGKKIIKKLLSIK